MPVYPFNHGPLHWNSPQGGGWFHPQGGFFVDGATSFSGKAWTSSDTLAARIIVGFNVGDVPTWTLDDLTAIVREIRQQQAGDPSASFVMQRGIYQHRDASKRVVQEDGAQVFIIDTTGLAEAVFEDQMVWLAEQIAGRLQQETVILEIQRNGITQRVHGITP